MEQNIWVELSVNLVVSEKGNILVKIEDPDFSSFENLMSDIKQKLEKEVADFLSRSTKALRVDDVAFTKTITCFYADNDGEPEINFPVSDYELKELMDEHTTTN